MLQLEQILIELPEIISGKNIWQNKFHEFDVYDHTIKMVYEIKKFTDNNELIVATYLHDIGKPVTKTPKIKEGKILEKEIGKPYHEFDNHEIVGEEIVKSMNYAFFSDFNINQNHVAKLVGAHYAPMKGIKSMRKTTDYESFLNKYNYLKEQLNATNLPRTEVMTMFIADCIAKGKGCTDIKELRMITTAIIKQDEGIEQICNIQQQMYHKN